MPELLEESIAEVKEQSALVADTGEASSSTLADETQAEPVIECHESTAESSDKLESPAWLDSGSEKAMVDESIAVLEEPVAVLEEPSAAVLEEPSAAVLDETGAILEEPSAAVLDESVAVLEEPSAAVPEEPVAVLEEPSAAVLDETGAIDNEPGAEHAAFESTSEAPELADEPIEIPAIEEAAAVLAAPIAEAADQGSVDSAAEPNLVADQVTETHDETARVDGADALV
jgi:hypothetical protein